MPVQKNAPAFQAPNEPKNDEPKSEEVTRETAPTETSKQDLPAVKEDVNATPQSYVHLADGTVLRVDNEDIPESAGHGNSHGFWQRGNKVYQVIGVYDAETVVEES